MHGAVLCYFWIISPVNEFYSTKLSEIILNCVHKKMTTTLNFENQIAEFVFQKKSMVAT